MDKAIAALDQIGKKVGTAAAILAAYLFFQVQELNEKVEKLDRTTSELAEVKEKVSSMDAKLDILITDFKANLTTKRSK
jgi:FtsZ-binding cell division protein ZapB